MSIKIECPGCRLQFTPEQAAASRLKRPTLEDVKAYCALRQNTVDPQKWFDHYTANGWKVGKNPMKDWQAAVRTWERDAATANTMSGDLCPLCQTYRMPPKARVCGTCGAYCRRCGEQTARLVIVKRTDQSLTVICEAKCLPALREFRASRGAA